MIRLLVLHLLPTIILLGAIPPAQCFLHVSRSNIISNNNATDEIQDVSITITSNTIGRIEVIIDDQVKLGNMAASQVDAMKRGIEKGLMGHRDNGSSDESISKKDLEKTSDLLRAAATAVMHWQSNLTPEQFKKEILRYLQKLKREGFIDGTVKAMEWIINCVLDNEVYTSDLVYMLLDLSNDKIEKFKEDPAKFKKDLIDDIHKAAKELHEVVLLC